MESCLCHGKLRQRRFSPRGRQFTFPAVMAFPGIDRLLELLRISPHCSYNKNWITTDERGHFGQPQKSLRERSREDAERNGVHPAKLAQQDGGIASKGELAP